MQRCGVAPLMPSPPTIVFSHANGFPAGTYATIFRRWRDAGYRVEALDKIGHDAAYPVSSNWPRLREQLVAFVQQAGGGAPVHLVGHSLGGMLSLIVASRRPELARSVVMLDSPVVGGWRAHGVHMAKLTGLIQRGGPGRVSVKRRWQWPSAEAAHAHFAAKAAFARWHPTMLQDYIAAGIEPDPDAAEGGGVRLAFRREVETRIYNTLPHNLAAMLRRHPPRCPVAYVAGTRSVEGRQAGLAHTRALVKDRLVWIEGSHLFPMEKPDETAEVVLKLLAAA